MPNDEKPLTPLEPIYKERRTILSGEHLWKLAAWTRAYFVELGDDGRIVLLFRGVECSADDSIDHVSWIYGAEGEDRGESPQSIAVISRDAAIRFAVEDAAAFLSWAWHRLEYMPAQLVPKKAELMPSPRMPEPGRRVKIEQHLREAWESFESEGAT